MPEITSKEKHQARRSRRSITGMSFRRNRRGVFCAATHESGDPNWFAAKVGALGRRRKILGPAY
jgi:hypothetical protein